MSKNKNKNNIIPIRTPGNKPLQPQDENLTVNIKNYELRGKVEDYMKDKSQKNFSDMMDCITESRILVPAKVNDSKKPLPMLITNQQGEHFIPIYTNKEQIPKEPKYEAIVNIPYLAINHMAANPDANITGIVINPFSTNLIFTPQLVAKVEEVERNKKEGKTQAAGAVKEIKLTEQQYLLFERRRYEAGMLPAKLFTLGQDFIDTLTARKEEYLDELYEESYQEKRRYPYLPEDFSVMELNISEELVVFRVDMPNRDLAPSAAQRVYIVWNPDRKEGHYYLIVLGEKKGELLLQEITADKRLIPHGAAPEDGVELSRIMDLAKADNSATS